MPTKTTPRNRWFHQVTCSSAQPANLTVVVEPQMAIRGGNRSITLTATIEVRTARPTATPTPPPGSP